MKFIDYLKDTRGELKHVSWPTQSQVISFTILVIIVSISVAFFLGLFDFIFTKLLDIFIFSDGGSSSIQITEEVIPTVEHEGVMEVLSAEEATDTFVPISL